MKGRAFYQNWFGVVSGGILLAGIIIAFFTDPAALPVGQRVLAKWVFGMLGATMMGWGITVFFAARYAFAHGVPELLKGILIGMAVWFVPDTLISAYLGVYFNVAVNVVILILASVPLIAGQRALAETGRGREI